MRHIRHSTLSLATLLVLSGPPGDGLAAQVEETPNVVYGMHYGTALLMDVHHPAAANGRGVVFIGGSGFHAPGHYGAGQLKHQLPAITRALKGAGYTVFAVNHRAAPGFRYPAAVEDAQRAVRFIRENADQFGITAEPLAAVGASSGGHLAAMLGVLDGTPTADDEDTVNRRSAKVQCVAALMAPTNFMSDAWVGAAGAFHIASFVGYPPQGPLWGETFRDASPVSHVSEDDAAFLLMHGTDDAVVPFEQSEQMRDSLAGAGVPVEHIPIPGVGHGPPSVWGEFDWRGPLLRWLDDCMEGAGGG